MTNLQEKWLITYKLVPCVISTVFYGILTLLVLEMYTVMPVYETSDCQNFYWNFLRSNNEQLSEFKNAHYMIWQTNIVFFILLNCVEISALFLIAWFIRNIKDELSIKLELFYIIAGWATFSTIYIGIVSSNITFKDELIDQGINESSLKCGWRAIIFCMIILRNLWTASVSTYFCYRSANNPAL